MDCSSGAFVGAITTYESGSRDHTESQESSARSTTLETGDLVKLFADGFGEVGLASVVEARPQGEWLGVVIPVEPWLFVLLRPQSFITEAQQLRMNPCQRGLSSFMDAINRTVLWRATDILKVSGDSPSNSTTYIRQDDWPGREVHRKDSEGVLLSSGRVFCYKPDDYFQDSTLGEDQVGVTVLDVFVGDRDAIMSHARWPTSECWFPNGRSLKETVDYFANIPDVPDPLAFLGGISKAPYRFVVRKRRSIDKVSAFLRKTTDAEIRKVSSERCCSRQCCQFFPRETTLKVREIFYSKSFEGRKEYGIAAGGHLREVDWTKKLRYLMLEEFDVCATAWYIIHGIPKSTFHNYVHKYNQKVLSTTHGNRGVKRPRIATVQVTGTVKAIIDENADQMPHQMRGIGHGRKDTRKLLPSVHNWKRIRLDANQLNVDYGLPVVSQSTISRIKKDHFNNVSIKAVGSSFAKCSTCDSLQQFILKSPKGSPDYVVFTRQRNLHLNHQASCRRLYASWREESKRNPQEILCIIHDKMDTAKTALPRMRVTTKATQGLGQLPMSVTGMVSHGHGDGAYAHYAPSVWPGDSNFTISSLARLLRRLEGPPIRETGHLFPHPPANPLFEALLRGKSRCMNILKLIEPSSRRGSLPLPPKLFLQLDNSAKDNKNQYLMAFLSLLTARGVFKEIQVGFLLVGHTHEDIDSYFSHLSTSLKGENTYVVADLMKQFMESQELSFMPEFVQEVGDFKSFVKGYLCTGTTRIIGLGEMHLFRFYVENDGVPVMKYKKSAIDSHWLPSDTTSRCLWKRDHQGRAMLPHGCPKPAEFKPVWGSEVPKATGNQEKARELAHKATVNKGFILSGLEKHILYWQSGIKKCRGFAAAFSPYVEYWQRVLLELKAGPPDCPAELLEGFWPSHDWRQSPTESTVGQSTVNPLDMVPEEEAPEPYCGPANEAPRESFNPWFDIRPGSWVLLRPEDPSVCDVWQGRALSEVCKEAGHEKIGKFMIQYWRPDNSESTLELRYRNCWYGKWVVEESGPAWVDAACVVYATWSKVVNPKSRTIPKKSREAALANLTRSNEVDP